MSEKNKNFHRLATNRTEAALTALRLIGNLSSPNYEWEPEEVMHYFHIIKSAIDENLDKFKQHKKWVDPKTENTIGNRETIDESVSQEHSSITLEAKGNFEIISDNAEEVNSEETANDDEIESANQIESASKGVSEKSSKTKNTGDSSAYSFRPATKDEQIDALESVIHLQRRVIYSFQAKLDSVRAGLYEPFEPPSLPLQSVSE